MARLKPKGVQLRNEVMYFHNRKLVFLSGPEGITVELSEWGYGVAPNLTPPPTAETRSAMFLASQTSARPRT